MTAFALSGSCHCGTVSWTLSDRPEKLTRCNCTLCRRIGALWAHAARQAVTLRYKAEDVVQYAHGDKTLAVLSCKTCGCTTHYEGLGEYADRCAVNANMAEPAHLEGLRIRHFDGADSWQYLD